MHINDIQKLKHQISSKCTNLKIPKRLRLPSQQNAAIHITIQLMRRTIFFFLSSTDIEFLHNPKPGSNCLELFYLIKNEFQPDSSDGEIKKIFR